MSAKSAQRAARPRGRVQRADGGSRGSRMRRPAHRRERLDRRVHRHGQAALGRDRRGDEGPARGRSARARRQALTRSSTTGASTTACDSGPSLPRCATGSSPSQPTDRPQDWFLERWSWAGYQAASRRRAFCTDGSATLALARGRARGSTLSSRGCARTLIAGRPARNARTRRSRRRDARAARLPPPA
jgi:hypothetical protein